MQSVWAVAGAMMLSACSVNSTGLVERSLVQADGAVVDTLEARGLHINTERDVFSVTLGTYRDTRVYPAHCVGSDIADPELTFRAIRGGSFQIERREIGFALGISERLRLRPVSPKESRLRKLTFPRGDPEATVLIFWDEKNCGGTL